MALEIKKLEAESLEEATRLFIACFKEKPWEEEWSYECAFNRLSDLIQANGFIGFIVYLKGRPVGCVMGNVEHWHYGLSYQIKELFIDTGCQGKGIGSMLLGYISKDLEKKNIKYQTLQTLNRPNTIAFYEKNGFKTDKTLAIMKNKLSI